MTDKKTEAKSEEKGKEAPKTMAPAKRDPLDHDGDGKKGGVAPKQESKEVGKTVKVEKEPTGTDTKSIDPKDYEGNPNIGSSEGTKPAESPTTKGNERDRDDGAGGVRATMGNQSLSPVATPGTPNSPDSTTRDIPAEATRKEAAALSRSPADNKEENYPETDEDVTHDPYAELAPGEEQKILANLDEIDEAERREAEQKSYIGHPDEYRADGKDTPLKASIRHNASKHDSFVVYGVGRRVITLGDLRNGSASVKELKTYLEERGKKKNFPLFGGEGPKLNLGDI